MLFLVKIELHRVRFVAREQRNAAERIEEKFALERDALLRLAGNDLAVVRIVAFDQFRDEQRVVQIERDLVVADAHLHVAIVGQQALQFGDRFGRHDDVGFLAAREFHFDIDHGQAAAVGRDHRELVLLETERGCR